MYAPSTDNMTDSNEEVCPIDCLHTPAERRAITRRERYDIDWSDAWVQALGHPEGYR